MRLHSLYPLVLSLLLSAVILTAFRWKKPVVDVPAFRSNFFPMHFRMSSKIGSQLCMKEAVEGGTFPAKSLKRSKSVQADVEVNANSYIAELTQCKTDNDVASFTRRLKTFASTKIKRSKGDAVCDQVYDLVEDWTHKLTAEFLADWIWSLGKIGFKVFIPKYKALCSDLLHRLSVADGLTARQVTTSFGGFARMSVRWEKLSPMMQQDFVELVGSVCHKLNDREIGNLLHSMSKMGIPWSELPPSLQAGILESLKVHSKELISQQGSMVIYSLGIMGLEIDRLTPASRDHIYLISLSVLSETSQSAHFRYYSQQTSNVIYGLAKMGAQIDDCPPHVAKGVYHAVLQVMPKMNEQEVANTVYSLCLMGAQWDKLDADIREMIESTLSLRFENMTTQGVSNSIYGLGVMRVKWNQAPASLRNAIHDVIVQLLHPQRIDARQNSQAVANIIYALGLMEAVWHEFPADVVDTLLHGFVACGDYLKNQELSNLVYGLGLLRADFHSLPPVFMKSFTTTFVRSCSSMNEQEVCSTLHGMAKMEAIWSQLSPRLRKAVIISAAGLPKIGSLCLACVIYSLGMLGARWDELPSHISDHVVLSSTTRPLKDQTLSNTLYGLSLMQAEWDSIAPELKATLIHNLAQDDALGQDIPQHVANILWALGKMDATWYQLPADNIQKALLRCVGNFKHQEAANIMYGLSIVDVPWDGLSIDVSWALEQSIVGCVDRMTSQELANVMYALALMTFDFDYSFNSDPEVSASGKKKNKTTKADLKKTKKDGTPEKEHEYRLHCLWNIHRAVLSTFRRADPDFFEKENFDQFAMYFELMRANPYAKLLVEEIFDGKIPNPSGPSATIPSRLHASTVAPMMEKLREIDPLYSGYHEFNGLRGVFPVDTAVFHGDKLVALVEVDGEFHYKLLGEQLRRKDQLKEYLYRVQYPDTRLYRMRSDQLNTLGFARAGEALALWIIRDLKK